MAVQQITRGLLRTELTFLTVDKVTTSYVENGLDDTDNNNGFMQSTSNGYRI